MGTVLVSHLLRIAGVFLPTCTVHHKLVLINAGGQAQDCPPYAVFSTLQLLGVQTPAVEVPDN
jgi:hypothetical protein